MRALVNWMRSQLRSLARSQDGVAAVEFALIAPAFFALLLAIIDVSRYMWVLNTMQYAIDEAVRYGVIRELPDDDIKAHVEEALQPVSTSGVTVTVASTADEVTVTAVSNYTFFFPISVAISNTSIDLRTEMPL